MRIKPEIRTRFRTAAAELERFNPTDDDRLDDCNTATELRKWLDSGDEALPWSGTSATPDERFFITTLYGQMTLAGPRTLVRKFFRPLFARSGPPVHGFCGRAVLSSSNQ
jgi:hypothetical protein